MVAAPEPAPEPGGADERLRILRMVREAKITPEEAARLLDAIAAAAAGRSAPRGADPGSPRRVLRIRVFEDGEEKVHVNLPMEFARGAVRLIPKTALRKLEGIDLEAVLSRVEAGWTGKIMEIRDDDDDGVEITVE